MRHCKHYLKVNYKLLFTTGSQICRLLCNLWFSRAVDFVNPIYRQLAAALLSDLVIRRIKNYTDRRLFSRRKVSDVFPHSLYTVSHASPTCAILLKDKPLLTRATCRRQIITKMILQGRKQAVAVTVANMSSKTENHCKSKLLITSIPN